MDFVGDRRVLVRAVADAVVEVTRMAENGISISNIVTEVQTLRDKYLNASTYPTLGSESVEVTAVLRRILRKKAQAYWALANSQEQQGNRDGVLQYYRVSVVLDGAADALSGLLPTSIPSRTNLDQRTPVPAAARPARTPAHLLGAAL